MKISETNRWASGFMLLVLLVLAGCARQTLPDLTAVPTLTSTLPVQFTSTNTATIIPSPSATATPIPTKAATRTPLPTITQTPLPSLEPTQAIEAIQKFLSQGMDCQSPCFFGIIPGQTTFDQASNIFNWLRYPLWHSPVPEFYSADIDYKDIELSVILEIKDDTVKNIQIRIGLDKSKGDPNPLVWQAFSPDALLNKYGPPTQVGFSIVYSPSPPGPPPEDAIYAMILYFDHLDLIISYGLGYTKDGKTLKICPLTDQFEGVRIYIGKDPIYPPDFQLPLEKASSLTLDQFSNLMTQKSKPACFEINKEAFLPTPEP